MPVILKDGDYAGYDAIDLRFAAKKFNELMVARSQPFSVITIENELDLDGGRYQVERTVDYVWIYRVLPTGLLYIAKAYNNGTEEIYGDNETLGENLAVAVLNDIIKNINFLVSRG